MPDAPSNQVNGVMPAGASGFAVAIADTLVAGNADLMGKAGSEGPNRDSTDDGPVVAAANSISVRVSARSAQAWVSSRVQMAAVA